MRINRSEPAAVAAPTTPGRALPAALGLGTLLVYVLLAGPTFYWLDSSELVAAAQGLGIAHPPGHPLASLLAKLVTLIPVGTLAFRVSLCCALQAAATTALLARLCQLVADEALPPAEGDKAAARRRRIVQLASAAAALTAGLSYALAFQAVRAEVYALNAMLLVAGVLQLVHWHRDGDRRRLAAAGLVAGLALCNHHLLVALAMPAVAVFLFAWRKREADSRRAAVAFVLALLVGLATLAYLPLRAAQNPRVGWGTPTTMARFGWVVSARLFMRTPGRVAKNQPLAERAAGVGFALMGALGPAGALLGLAGLYLLWRRQGTRQLAALFSLLVLGNVTSPLLVGFDPFNPDAYGYLAVGVVFLAVPLAVLVAIVADALASWRPAAAVVSCALALVVPARQLWAALPRADLRAHWAAEETARATLDQPPGALLLTSFFETIFNVWALRESADARPDLAVVHRNFRQQPGYVERESQRQPELARQLARWRDRDVTPSDLRTLAARRAVRFEYDLNVGDALARALNPDGLLLQPDLSDGTTAHTRAIMRWRDAIGPVDDNETRRAVVWTHYLWAHYACRRQLSGLAHKHIAAAREIVPGDRQLAKLAASCR
ncbi:MAG: DUF2723 domain-containing protein [Myxococcales bacterium]|nr:DUF2723 domain-containing protein [Myxococcales bacterium]